MHRPGRGWPGLGRAWFELVASGSRWPGLVALGSRWPGLAVSLVGHWLVVCLAWVAPASRLGRAKRWVAGLTRGGRSPTWRKGRAEREWEGRERIKEKGKKSFGCLKPEFILFLIFRKILFFACLSHDFDFYLIRLKNELTNQRIN